MKRGILSLFLLLVLAALLSAAAAGEENGLPPPAAPTTASPTTGAPTTASPTTASPTSNPTAFANNTVVRLEVPGIPADLQLKAGSSSDLWYETPNGDNNHLFTLQHASAANCGSCYRIIHRAPCPLYECMVAGITSYPCMVAITASYPSPVPENFPLLLLCQGDGGDGADVWALEKVDDASGRYFIHHQSSQQDLCLGPYSNPSVFLSGAALYPVDGTSADICSHFSIIEVGNADPLQGGNVFPYIENVYTHRALEPPGDTPSVVDEEEDRWALTHLGDGKYRLARLNTGTDEILACNPREEHIYTDNPAVLYYYPRVKRYALRFQWILEIEDCPHDYLIANPLATCVRLVCAASEDKAAADGVQHYEGGPYTTGLAPKSSNINQLWAFAATA